MDLVALLVITAIVVLGICALILWLIARAVKSKEQIEELQRRADDLELQVARLKRTPPPAEPEPAQEFKSAVLPPRKEEPAEFAPSAQPLASPISATAFVATPPPPSKPIEPPKPIATPPPFVPPPPIIPPMSPEIDLEEPKPEPELETAKTFSPIAPIQPEEETIAKDSSFEMRLGTYWLVRIGIVMLLAGLAFFANLAYHHIVTRLGAGGKIALLYLASGLLLGAGAWWQRRNVKESLKNYAQVLFAGGLAAVYFTTYAAHHFAPLRVIESAALDGSLLFAWAGVIAWIADRRKSEVMALFAVGLAFFTSVITRVGEFTLYSNLILTIAAVVFLLRNRWATLSFASLVTSYGGYAFWRFLHDDGWRWATPNENLWLGTGFLACYWLVFTAATFLSKCEKLSGANRAAFLTLNNGAFFGLFLLTMIQVNTGDFWKVSLGYGTVLLALAALARKFLSSEPLTKNSYLTQGLVFVTLGFITKFSGLKLALVLGAESVVLYVLATQRASTILKFFAWTCAALATGWCVTMMQPFDTPDLWMGAGLGAMLTFNAFWSHRSENKSGDALTRLESTLFTLLAFACWTATIWFNTAEPHLPVALVLAVESAVFFNLIGGLKIPAPKIAAYASAACAVGWCVINLKQLDSTGLWTGVTVGLIMVLNAVRAHRHNIENSQPLRAEPTAFTLLAFASWLATTYLNTTEAHLPLVLAFEAVALTFSIYLLRVREITLLGQFFLVFAQFAWLFHFINVTPPLWNPLCIIAITVGLSHWWQHQKILVVSRNIFVCYSAVFALASVAVVLVWLHPLVSAPAWLALTSLLAAAVTVYGLVTRLWPLAICGQIFLAVSTWEFLRQLFDVKPEWYFPLVPLATLTTLSFATAGWFQRKPESSAAARNPLLQIAMVYRWLALVMSLIWIWDYVPERQRIWAYMLAAVVIFALAVWLRSREALVATAVYAFAALTMLWCRDDFVMDLYWPNLLSLLALFGLQQILRRMSPRLTVPEQIHSATIIIAGLALWRFLWCWAAQINDAYSVTMVWAGLAVVMFAAGIVLRERFHRWFGLGLLAAAVGRVVLVDVWTQETIWRVLTFMALGVALLVIGFVYNKYQEKIRQWL